MLQSSRRMKLRNFQRERHLAEITRMRLPLFVFSHGFLRPHSGHEERFFMPLIRVRPPRKRSDTERGQARFLRSETKQGQKEKLIMYRKMKCNKKQSVLVAIILISVCAFAQWVCSLCINTGNVQCNSCMGVGVVTQISASGIPVNVRCRTCSGRGVVPCSCRKVRTTPYFGRERRANCRLCGCAKWKFDYYGSCIYCGHSIAQH